MPLVKVYRRAGRPAQENAKAFEAFEALGVPPADLFVILSEPPLENWSVRNGLSSFDAKPAFKLDV